MRRREREAHKRIEMAKKEGAGEKTGTCCVQEAINKLWAMGAGAGRRRGAQYTTDEDPVAFGVTRMCGRGCGL